jgi:hypothetical protein
MKVLIVLLFILCSTPLLLAQFNDAIEDNSFLIEEAYNQEAGVIQHIFAGSKNPFDNFFEINFTQELPIFSQAHQLSYTIPFLISSHYDGDNGMGDILLNYRYQLINENGLAVAPRFSIILPSGDKLSGFGNDVFGMQINFPLSKRWDNEFVAHFNAGLTFLPNVRPGDNVNSVDVKNITRNITTYSAGASGIFLASPHFNIMTEVIYSSTSGSNEIILSPGFRYAINIGDLQIVPGLAFPFYFTSGSEENGIFLYLSFEHPF